MEMLKHHWRSFLGDPWQGKYLLLLLAVNILGSLYGYYWYSEQLAETPKTLWLFVPDSPLSTTLFALVAIFALWGHRNLYLEMAAYMSCIKYGLWAVVVIVDFWNSYGHIGFETAMLSVSHLGMAVQAVIYLSTLRFNGRAVIMPPGYPGRFIFSARTGMLAVGAASVWLLLNDFLDYYLGIHPYLYYTGQEPVAELSAWGLSATVIIAVLIRFYKLVQRTG